MVKDIEIWQAHAEKDKNVTKIDEPPEGISIKADNEGNVLAAADEEQGGQHHHRSLRRFWCVAGL